MSARRAELSTFLRAKRAGIKPEQVGLEVTGTRRTAGLRREEVALLSNVSVDWYTRLEQGRQVSPSPEVLHSIAHALQLSAAERDYLVNLARPVSGVRVEDDAPPAVRPGISKMIRAFDLQPAFVLGPRQYVLDGNALAWKLLANFPAFPPTERNLLRWIFTAPDVRNLYLDWEVIAREMVGVLQLEASAHPRDAKTAELVAELSALSDTFREWWAMPSPQGRTSGTKRFHHPRVGRLDIDWEAFTLQDDDSQTVFVYTARDAQSKAALEKLASLPLD